MCHLSEPWKEMSLSEGVRVEEKAEKKGGPVMIAILQSFTVENSDLVIIPG